MFAVGGPFWLVEACQFDCGSVCLTGVAGVVGGVRVVVACCNCRSGRFTTGIAAGAVTGVVFVSIGSIDGFITGLASISNSGSVVIRLGPRFMFW